MIRLLLISDTHIPGRARALPHAVLQEADAADLVIHAGDWVSTAVLDELETHAEVLGVYGNNDGPDLRFRLPEVARRSVDGVSVSVVHETGDAARRHRRVDVEFSGSDLVVFGHSHIPWDTVTPGGIRLLNPGSPTDRRRQPRCTMMTAVAVDGALRDVALVEVERPAAAR